MPHDWEVRERYGKGHLPGSQKSWIYLQLYPNLWAYYSLSKYFITSCVFFKNPIGLGKPLKCSHRAGEQKIVYFTSCGYLSYQKYWLMPWSSFGPTEKDAKQNLRNGRHLFRVQTGQNNKCFTEYWNPITQETMSVTDEKSSLKVWLGGKVAGKPERKKILSKCVRQRVCVVDWKFGPPFPHIQKSKPYPLMWWYFFGAAAAAGGGGGVLWKPIRFKWNPGGGIRVLKRRGRKTRALFLSVRWGQSKKLAFYKPGRGLFLKTQPCWSLDLGLPASWPVRNKFLLFKPASWLRHLVFVDAKGHLLLRKMKIKRVTQST